MPASGTPSDHPRLQTSASPLKTTHPPTSEEAGSTLSDAGGDHRGTGPAIAIACSQAPRHATGHYRNARDARGPSLFGPRVAPRGSGCVTTRTARLDPMGLLVDFAHEVLERGG